MADEKIKHYISGDCILICLLVVFTLNIVMFAVFSRDAFSIGKDIGVQKEKIEWIEEQVLILQERG